MKNAFRRRSGLTLAEILVALAILAVMAALLLPSLTGQVRKGSYNRAAGDLTSVRTGIEAFLADVHRYPSNVGQLTKVVATSDSDINAVTYPAGLVARWKGPYISRDTVNAVLPTAFGGSILNGFVKLSNTNSISYVTVRITGISQTEFYGIDEVIDGDTGTTKGSLRWVSGAGSADTTKYLAVPIQ